MKLNAAGERVFRLRGIIGGNISDYTGDRYSGTADILTFNLLGNVVVCKRAHFRTVDIHDFYLMSGLERP